VSKRAHVVNVSSAGDGSDPARPLPDACPPCEWCGRPLVDRRANTRYCDVTCRAAACHARRGTRPKPKKALRSVANGRKQRIRRKHGTDLYVVRDEVELVRDLLAGKRPASAQVRARLMDKIPRALERIERKAA